ncbi:DUF397 domain-containing protein [Actinomadura vinacea]|uniref:DUF397 domain-containing protein n=1 Tax=Actinomadura vinacea TaxID=115336 RepID=A0ABN3JZ54_9ACTN
MDSPTPRWRKSSRSDDHGGACVEVADLTSVDAVNAPWRKSSHSDQHGGECVEVADLAHVVGVRDSKDPDGPMLAVTAADWRSFIRRVKANEL